MQLSKKFFSPNPINDGTDPKEINRNDETSDSSLTENNGEQQNDTEHKSFKTSLRDALQEWSNDDARDIEEDDSTPMRSGL